MKAQNDDVGKTSSAEVSAIKEQLARKMVLAHRETLQLQEGVQKSKLDAEKLRSEFQTLRRNLEEKDRTLVNYQENINRLTNKLGSAEVGIFISWCVK